MHMCICKVFFMHRVKGRMVQMGKFRNLVKILFS